MWALKNKEKVHEYSKSLQLSVKRRYGWSRFTKVAGWWLQLSIKADLSCSEAALLVRMFAVERHIFPVRNHGICNVEWPALHSTNNHTASLSRDETASCENEYESITQASNTKRCVAN